MLVSPIRIAHVLRDLVEKWLRYTVAGLVRVHFEPLMRLASPPRDASATADFALASALIPLERQALPPLSPRTQDATSRPLHLLPEVLHSTNSVWRSLR